VTLSDCKVGAYEVFSTAVLEVCTLLAQGIVRDGEGATKFITVAVEQGRSIAECLAVAYAIAESPLVKTAFFASDPNWGRILAAAGRSGARFNPDQVSVSIGPVSIFERGTPTMTAKTEAKAVAVMKRPEYQISLVAGTGRGLGHYWTCDLGHEYVRINADYRT